MTRNNLIISTAFTISSLLFFNSADAYNVMQTQYGPIPWKTMPVKFDIHQAYPSGQTMQSFQAAIQKGHKAWDDVSCSFLSIQDLGLVSRPKGNSNDKINTHVYLPGWPSDMDPNALAVTWSVFTANEMLDADTFYNPNYTWTTDGSKMDIQAVATHEIGHQLGLDHSSQYDATMFFATPSGETKQRSLHSDDIDGVCFLYPNGSQPKPECTGAGQCAPSEVCIANKCAPGSKAGYAEACSTPSECTSGLCLTSSVGGLCTQFCTDQPCPNNHQCLQTNGGSGQKICLPKASSNPQQGTKDLGETCSASAECISQKCVQSPTLGTFCSQNCVTGSTNSCPEKYECVASAIGNICIPSETTDPPKKSFGETCTTNDECTSQLCGGTSKGKYCTALCDAQTACPDSAYECVSVSSTQSACAKKTSESKDPNDDPAKLIGAACSEPSECESNVCAVLNDGDPAVCTLTCDSDDQCPKSYGICGPDTNGQKVCGAQSDGSGCALGNQSDISLFGLSLLFCAWTARRRNRFARKSSQ